MYDFVQSTVDVLFVVTALECAKRLGGQSLFGNILQTISTGGRNNIDTAKKSAPDNRAEAQKLEDAEGFRVLRSVGNFLTSTIVGAAIAGADGAISFASFNIAGKLLVFSSKADKEKQEYREYLNRKFVLYPAVIFGAMGFITGVSAWNAVFDRDHASIKQVTDRAITRVVNGEKLAAEPGTYRGYNLFGLEGSKIGEFRITAEEKGSDGVCKTIRITRDGQDPYVIAARPPSTKKEIMQAAVNKRVLNHRHTEPLTDFAA